MTPTQRALKALREAKESGRGAALILLMLERKPSAFYDCWREMNKGDKKPVVPPALIRGAGKRKKYKCKDCGEMEEIIGLRGFCLNCDPFYKGEISTEAIQ
jgi:hypothetical protein